LFGDFTTSDKSYQKIDNIEEIPKKLNEYLAFYNSSSPKQMNLVFFKDAIMHISRLCRVLRQQRGNMLLIGVGGSGRQSLTKLASHIRAYTCF